MAKYKVNEGHIVRWPDGSTRANSGEVFEGYDDAGPAELDEFMSAILFNQRTAFGGAVDDEVSSTAKVPAPIMADMGQRGYVAKPRKKKTPATKRAKGEAKGD